MKKLILTSFLILITLIQLCNSTAQTDAVKPSASECNSKNCVLPLCKCSNTERPGKIEFDDTPMMIAITFNGILNSNYMKNIKKILDPIYKNPNGCPIHGTFFVSDKGNGTTDYCVVQSLFNNNNEISVGSVKYECPYTDCGSNGKQFRPWKDESSEKDILEQKKKIALKSRINRSFLRGFRTPHLDQAGSVHFKALKKYAFNYDSSAIIKPADIKKQQGFRFWPHTLDFPATYECPTCPKVKSFCNGLSNCSMNSIWIVPMHYLNAEGKNPCPSLIKDEKADNRFDAQDCLSKNKLTQKVIEEQLFDNFRRHYDTNKAPFVINIETIWLDKYGDMLTGAFRKFVNNLTNPNSEFAVKNDIYFVSVSKIIEWIEYPTSLRQIGNRWLWDCDGSSYDYDEECQIEQKIRENSEELEEIKKKNKTTAMEYESEILFRNGVLSGVVIVFILSIIITVLYDKFNSKK